MRFRKPKQYTKVYIKKHFFAKSSTVFFVLIFPTFFFLFYRCRIFSNFSVNTTWTFI